MTQDISIAALLAIFRRLPHFVITSHERPDGDAIGSVLAFAEILDQLGCTSEVVLAGPAPETYANLPNIDRIRFASAPGIAPRGRSRDGLAPVIVLECDSIERTGLRGLEGRSLINIDHHVSSRNFGVINWIDASACAVAAMVYRLAIAAQVEITPSMATCLYAAILSDTGSFNYASTNAESFAIAHDLTRRGASPSQIARDLYHSNPLSKVRILSTALNALQVSGNLAWSWVTLNDLGRADAIPEDCEGIVGNLIAINGVEAAFFLREQLDGFFRLSLRSKGKIDVAAVAEGFGGGGHKTASGCTMHGPLHMAVDRLLTALRSAHHNGASVAPAQHPAQNPAQKTAQNVAPNPTHNGVQNATPNLTL
jgi:phosphoesterase RecJ-like protein